MNAFNKNNLTQLKRKPAPSGGGDYGFDVQWFGNDKWRDYVDLSFKGWPMQEERPCRQKGCKRTGQGVEGDVEAAEGTELPAVCM
jgi:hypothetical protein